MEDLPAMDRPLRLELVGPCYHVINCGSFRFPVFREVRDCELQLGKLVEVAERFRVRTVGGLCAARDKMARRLYSPAEGGLRATVAEWMGRSVESGKC